MQEVKARLEAGEGVLGIELGSTRIKAVLTVGAKPVASGAFDWQNELVNGIWTYSLEQVAHGLRETITALRRDVSLKYGLTLTKLKALGVSAMMHGYLAFDKDDNLLVPFRTWRNTITGRASKILSERFSFPIPERWSIAHLYEAILNDEPHVKDLARLTTLSGYVHYMLTGKHVLGVCDASGMFPVLQADFGKEKKCCYDSRLLDSFDALIQEKHFPWNIKDVLPEPLCAGDVAAGTLTPEGAAWLDPDGLLEAGIPVAPPEGDAATGMVATNSVSPRTGNVSAGTSVFAMVVLEKPLSSYYPGVVDIVSSPTGAGVAMVHANNCTGEYDKWISLFAEAARLLGATFTKDELYQTILGASLSASADCGGLLSYNYISGESITGLSAGVPLFARGADSCFTLSNFMRAQVYSALCTLTMGMRILFEKEHVNVDFLMCHGGFFKTKDVGLKALSNALRCPACAVTETASEGGAWGMALLCEYLVSQKNEPLDQWLGTHIFSEQAVTKVLPEKEGVAGFEAFFERYKQGLSIEREAVAAFKE